MSILKNLKAKIYIRIEILSLEENATVCAVRMQMSVMLESERCAGRTFTSHRQLCSGDNACGPMVLIKKHNNNCTTSRLETLGISGSLASQWRAASTHTFLPGALPTFRALENRFRLFFVTIVLESCSKCYCYFIVLIKQCHHEVLGNF